MDEEKCEDCGGCGWLHMGEPFEIQECDSCSILSDRQAISLHEHQCGCDWPSIDYQNLVHRFIEDNRDYPPAFREAVYNFRTMALDRKNFARNVPSLVFLFGKVLDIFHKTPELELYSFRSVLENLKRLSMLLIHIDFLIKSGQWKDHWLWVVEDGKFQGERWIAAKAKE